MDKDIETKSLKIKIIIEQENKEEKILNGILSSLTQSDLNDPLPNNYFYQAYFYSKDNY